MQLEDGRWYKDWSQGLHGNLYGYRPPWWSAAIAAAANNACANSFGYRDERIVAEMLAGLYPDVEAVRFMVNGSDPCAAASKLARAVTGRDKLLVYGYHGTASAYCTPPEVNSRPGLAAMDMRRGTLQAERDAFVPLEWGEDPRRLIDKSIAAVVVECPPVDDADWPGASFGPAAWLQGTAGQAHKVGALFVLDEVVTGFRYGPSGAASYYHLHGLVDLYCFGKTMGNGYPVAALAGKREIMDELANGVHFSGTFFAEPLGLAAAKATLNRLLDEPPWPHLYGLGEYLKNRWNALDLPWQLVGHPTRPILEPCHVEADRLTDLRRHLFRRGHVVVDHPWYVTMAHSREDVDALCEAVKECLQ